MGKLKSSTKSWEELTFADNFLFCKILESEPELCKELLELLLHIKIDHLEVPQMEKTMQEGFESKSVRFDVFTKDDGRIFDIEMQTTDTKNLPKRARYYQSVIDMDNLSKGEKYSKLKDSYIVFICLDDIFNKGLPVYFFENLCRQKRDLSLNDRTYKVFFNAKDCDKLKTLEERDFFNFLKGNHAESRFAKTIEEKVERAKKNEKWRKVYMTWQQTIDEEKEIAREEGLAEGREEGLEEGRKEGLEEGREEGRKEGAQAKSIENAKNLLRMNLGTPEQISQAVSLPLEQVLAFKDEMKC
ncbi:Rpn family recombination-promoting nuclease/putative transposase [uncultured Treponema sp.]|uniref:Rpn family recombination-promoting nuclease/putative transposase n=1 Tax=uncultured Treponema sp. TaxID=162155 RepID=UPI0025D0691F|nr:Rpn family recombination-promoting nuclease/putative transposase [uncultured Treponema sp.]